MLHVCSSTPYHAEVIHFQGKIYEGSSTNRSKKRPLRLAFVTIFSACTSGTCATRTTKTTLIVIAPDPWVFLQCSIVSKKRREVPTLMGGI